jgi:hypothetical protein
MQSFDEAEVLEGLSSLMKQEAVASDKRLLLEESRLKFEREKWLKETEFQHKLQLMKAQDELESARLLREKEHLNMDLLKKFMEKN